MNPNDPNFLSQTFTYHASTGTQIGRYTVLQRIAGDFVEAILDACPESAERTLAIRKVQEAVMWANASIAINENPIYRGGLDPTKDPVFSEDEDEEDEDWDRPIGPLASEDTSTLDGDDGLPF